MSTGDERLEAAERVCLMFGWSPARHETDREKAAHELWLEWCSKVPESFLNPETHPELDDEAVQRLARQRDATRERTLRRIEEEGS